MLRDTMEPTPDVLEGRLEKIAYPHIREKLQALRNSLPAMLEYVDQLLLDTRDGKRRGFDLETASVLLDLKLAISSALNPSSSQEVIPWDSDFKVATPGRPYVPPAQLPKGW